MLPLLISDTLRELAVFLLHGGWAVKAPHLPHAIVFFVTLLEVRTVLVELHYSSFSRRFWVLIM
jgi:hypothetical protein